MINKYNTENNCIEEQYNNRISKIHYKWFIFCLIQFILIILTYKLWGKPSPLENLISIGSGLVSIALGSFAIIYSISENIKTNNKENKVDVILDEIEKNVFNMNNIVIDIREVTNSSFNELTGIKRMNTEIKEKISNFNYKKFNQEANDNLKDYIKTKDKGMDEKLVTETVTKDIMKKLSKGDICMANLGESNPSILGGIRPVIIVQNNIANKYTPSLTIVPVTSRIPTINNIPTHVTFELENRFNTAVIEQIRTISKNEIIELLGAVDIEILKKIEEGMLIQFDIQ